MAKEKKPGTQLKRVEAKTQLEPGEESIDEKRGRIWQDANEPFREKLTKIQEWFDVEARHSIRARWELGLIVKEIHDDVIYHRGTRYGVSAVEQIGQYFGWDEGVIYNSLKLAEKYSQEEIDELCQKRMPNGQRLSYSHLMTVISLPAPERKQLIDKAVSESLTSGELARIVVHGKEPARLRKDEKRGRPIGKPKTFDTELAQMESFVSDFLSRTDQVWYADDYSLDAKIADFSNEDYTEERAKRLVVLTNQLKRLSEMAKKLEELVRHIHGIFAKVRKETIPAPKTLGSPESKQKSTKDVEK